MYVCIVIDVNPKISLGFFTTSYKNLNERFGQARPKPNTQKYYFHRGFAGKP